MHLPLRLPYSTLLLLALAFVATGCATTYKGAQLESATYTGLQESNGVSFAYHYDPIEGYYGKKARKKGFAIVAVRVTNTLDTPVALNRNTLRVWSGEMPMSLLSPRQVAGNIEQPVWTYALWSLFTITIQDPDNFIILPVGIPIALVNIIASSGANGKMERSFRDESLLDRQLMPGETANGLIFLNTDTYPPLEFEIVGNSRPVEAAVSPTKES